MCLKHVPDIYLSYTPTYTSEMKRSRKVHDKVHVRYMIGICLTTMYLAWNPLYIGLCALLRYMLARNQSTRIKNSISSTQLLSWIKLNPVRGYSDWARTPVRTLTHSSPHVNALQSVRGRTAVLTSRTRGSHYLYCLRPTISLTFTHRVKKQVKSLENSKKTLTFALDDNESQTIFLFLRSPDGLRKPLFRMLSRRLHPQWSRKWDTCKCWCMASYGWNKGNDLW